MRRVTTEVRDLLCNRVHDCVREYQVDGIPAIAELLRMKEKRVKWCIKQCHTARNEKGDRYFPFDLGFDKGEWWSTLDNPDCLAARKTHADASSTGVEKSSGDIPQAALELGYSNSDVRELKASVTSHDKDVTSVRSVQRTQLARAQRKLESPKQKKRNKRKHDKEKGDE